MKGRASSFFNFLLGALIFCSVSRADFESNSPFLKIGVIGPLSGAAAAFGVAIKNGIELARSHIPALGRFDFLYEDDQSNPSRTVAAFHKLVQMDKVEVVICGGSTLCNAVAPLAESQKIPLLAYASDERVSAGRKFAIRTYATGFSEGATIAHEALRRDYQRIAVFSSVGDYPYSVRRGLVESFPKSKIVLDLELSAVEDFKPLLMRAKAMASDSFFICLNPGQSGLFARQLRQLQMQGGIFGCEYLNNLDELRAAQGSLSGAWFVTVQVSPDFGAEYRAVYGNDSALSTAAIHYDLMGILSRAISKRFTSGEIIQALLTAGEYEGAIGKSRFVRTKDDQFLDMELVVKTISGKGGNQ